MSSPHPNGIAQNFTQWPAQQLQGPPASSSNDASEEGFSVRPMRLKVLYTFDDQNKTNCLARGPDVLQVKTVALDERTSIGIIDLKTCIEALILCSPELNTRMGGDYTVYAYDYSEYDNPLVGQGMLSRALAAASPHAPAQQSEKLITGRVCKNILGIFSNGVKETLEVKLRLVPVPTSMQSEYVNTMEKYREMSSSTPVGFDQSEWNNLLQSNPNMSQMGQGQMNPLQSSQMNPCQMGARYASPVSIASKPSRESMNLEVVNQLLSPSLPPQEFAQDSLNQASNVDSGSEGKGVAATTATGKAKKTSRPSSRTAVKRPYRKRQPKAAATAAAVGGNTSGYEEGTDGDGDDGPAPRKRAKITQTDWNSKSSFGPASDSLRVAASTAGSLRLFRPIAMNTAAPGSHLEEIPRPPTPLPNFPSQAASHKRQPSQGGLRRDSFASQPEVPRTRMSSFPRLEPSVAPEDELRYSIESANPSPERNYSPAVETPPEIGSSPPFLRTASPMMRSSPCPSSPVLPQMPRTDSGFMSGSIEELFGEEGGLFPADDEATELSPALDMHDSPELPRHAAEELNLIMLEPGPMELLPTKMSNFTEAKLKNRPPLKAPKSQVGSRAGSVVSENGQILLSNPRNRPLSRKATPVLSHNFPIPPQVAQVDGGNDMILPQVGQSQQDHTRPQAEPEKSSVEDVSAPVPAAPSQTQSRPGSRIMVRTASMGALTLPKIPTSDPVLPHSTLQRSQTWSEAPHSATEFSMQMPMQMQMGAPSLGRQSTIPGPDQNKYYDKNGKEISYPNTSKAKKAAIKQRLEEALAKGEMPPFCQNCGTIETPTWRKAWSQEHQGVPGYYDYSDEPGRVTAVVVLTRDEAEKPTSYQIIKKFLAKEEDKTDFVEFTLCNPCGIWLSKYKSHRPADRWECNRTQPDPSRPKRFRKDRPSRSTKSRDPPTLPTSEANFPQSEANFPYSEAYFPHSETNYPQSDVYGPVGGISPTDTTGIPYLDRASHPTEQRVPVKFRPMKKLNAMTSDAASAALRRAIKSSPARWNGTRNSPIDVEEDDMVPIGDPTRRLLFPSPRKIGSLNVLGEVVTNVVQIATEFRSPKKQSMELPNKENCRPQIDVDDADAELLRLFDEELARPTTPIQKSPAPNLFKTPTRPTPSHRPITRSVSRSVSKSLRSAKSPGPLLMLAQRTPSRTPGSSSRRRSPKHHAVMFESPFTATLNQLISEANNNNTPSRHCNNMDLDFSNLPDLPNMGHNNGGLDMNYNMEDFFSTDIPMPSSPPRLGGIFNLYEDPDTMGHMDWSEFDVLNARSVPEGDDVEVKMEEVDEGLDEGNMLGEDDNS